MNKDTTQTLQMIMQQRTETDLKIVCGACLLMRLNKSDLLLLCLRMFHFTIKSVG